MVPDPTIIDYRSGLAIRVGHAGSAVPSSGQGRAAWRSRPCGNGRSNLHAAGVECTVGLLFFDF